MGKRKYKYEFIESYIKSEDYQFLTIEEEYTNVKTPLKLKCPNGHVYTTSWGHFFHRKHRCKLCNKHKIDYVKDGFNGEGYTLLEKEYNNSITKMMYLCPRGHKNSMTWNTWRNGSRCPECTKTSYSEVVGEFKQQGYKILSKEIEYTYAKFKFKFLCPSGHFSSMNWYNFKRGNRCGKCAPNKKRTLEDLRCCLASKGCVLLSDNYINSKKTLVYICSNGHKHESTWSNFNKGQGCPKCSATVSAAEQSIFESFSLLGVNVEQSNRTLIKPYELDLFFPDKNLAVEYCGLYWHSEISGGKDRKYHRMKHDLCGEKGIRLITVFEDEYLNKPKVVLSNISQALGLSKRLPVRKLILREVPKKEANLFYYENHLQGKSILRKSWGLYDSEGSLCCCLSLGPFTREHTALSIELKRMATLPNVTVVGGFSRLFSAALKYCYKNNITVIRSYCDNRYKAKQSVYEKMGFELLKESRYTLYYVLNGVRYRNQSLCKLLAEQMVKKTERKLRIEQGYDLIWDCGHRTYIYYLK